MNILIMTDMEGISGICCSKRISFRNENEKVFASVGKMRKPFIISDLNDISLLRKPF